MSKLVFRSVEDFLSHEGEKLGTSDWVIVSQDIINLFADVTRDHQWIHVDDRKAEKESPFGSTIAHGYLTLSLLPSFLNEIFHVDNLKQLVNYSVEKMVFKSVVPVNSKLRMTATLKAAKDLGNICKANIYCVFEIEGHDIPVLEGTIVFLYYFI